MTHNKIDISGARVHNLKNVDVTLPRYSVNVITGLSGSGNSSLAFDTLYAEGQRRYIEAFSAYARNCLDTRSTVGTVTEIYDFLRLH